MIRFYLNGVEKTIQDAPVYKECGNEELDSMTIVIPFSPRLEIKPYDYARFEIDDLKLYFVVDTYNEETCDFDDELFNYTIHLISETSLLDKVRLPNRKFTPRANRSVLWQCNEILKYANKNHNGRFSFSQEFINKFNNIIGVEKQFNKPTCREALNELVRIDNCIIKVANGLIDYVKLDTKGNSIDLSKLFLSNDSQNANDYASILRIDADNCQSPSDSIFTELLTLKSINQPVLNGDNMSLMTQHPIDEVSKFFAYIYYKYEGVDRVNRVDLVDSIVEKEIYDLLKVGTLATSQEERKLLNLYYTRHTNQIEGLTYNEDILGFDGKSALEMILERKMLANSINFSSIDYIKTIFTITYKSTESISFLKEKEQNYNKGIELTDNQIDNFINLDLFGKAEQEKVNRLGNKYKIITGLYNNFNDVPKVFDYIDDFILAERETVLHNDYYQFKGVLYQNYIQENMFYGVNAKRRSYEIESGSKAVTRQEIIYKKLVFSKNQSSTTPIARHLLMQVAGNNLPAYADEDGFGGVETLNDISSRRILSSKIKSVFSDSSESDIYRLAPFCSSNDKALLVNLRWYDNYSVGMYLSGNKLSLDNIGGMAQDFCKYVDDNGELIRFKIDLFDKQDIRITSTSYEFFEATKSLPLVKPEYEEYFYQRKNIADNIIFNFVKDSQEIPNITIQYEIKGSDNIIVTSNMINALLKRYNSQDLNWTYLYVAYSTSEKYSKDDKVMKDSAIKITDGSVEIDYTDLKKYLINDISFNRIKLYNNNIDTSNWKSWALVDNEGNLYLAVNREDNASYIPMAIYLNKEVE